MPFDMGDENHGYFGVFRLASYGQGPLISPPLPRNTSVSVKDLLNPEVPQDKSQPAIAKCDEHERQVSIPSRTILPYPSGMARTPLDKIRR